MKILDSGILNPPEAGGRRAVSIYPTLTVQGTDDLLATYRVGSAKDSEDEEIELRRSSDKGKSWDSPEMPFSSEVEGRSGSLKVVYLTPLNAGHLLAAGVWVDREGHQGRPYFNEQTEGVLPMVMVVADSFDGGKTFSRWRRIPVPKGLGPPAITCPVMRLKTGRLALSAEIGRFYDGEQDYRQRVLYFYSPDEGQSWSAPVETFHDSTGQLYYWDQRTAVAPDGRLAAFSWLYSQVQKRYLNISRHISTDEGKSWQPPDDLGITDQPSVPAVLRDGRLVLGWVDRFHTRTIRICQADGVDKPLRRDTELILHRLDGNAEGTRFASTGELLGNISLWTFGHPFVEPMPDGTVIMVYYAGSMNAIGVSWVRLALED